MADALAALDEMNRHIATLSRAANSGRSKNLPVSAVQPVARAIAITYFESIRPDLDAVKNRAGLVEEIDFVVQQILQLASSAREKQAYTGQLNELRSYLLEATIDLMKSRGTARLVLSQTERAILDTLAALLPSCAASYEQALRDIAQGARVSWRGTATELRETLREVMDHFAPDDKVSGAPGFQLEDRQSRPTQKQKVRYILKARRSSSTAVSVAEASLNTVEEAVALLARSTYQRGSASTHVGSTGKEIKSLKRYVDALLAELLEVSEI
jgi:Predicted pPIWI-associating nuclease